MASVRYLYSNSRMTRKKPNEVARMPAELKCWELPVSCAEAVAVQDSGVGVTCSGASGQGLEREGRVSVH